MDQQHGRHSLRAALPMHRRLLHANVKMSEYIWRVGMNYRFDWASYGKGKVSAVVAKYKSATEIPGLNRIIGNPGDEVHRVAFAASPNG